MTVQRSRPISVLLALSGALAALGAGMLAAAERAPAQRAQASVIGGVPADPASWQSVAAIRFRGKPHCGGSVIAPTKVLTAAHCVLGYSPARMTVITGRPNLADPSAGQVLGVVSAVAYPGYGISGAYDFGVLTLAQATTAPPVTLATAEETAAALAPGTPLRVAGWGDRTPVERTPGKRKPVLVLQAVTQFPAGDAACFKEYGRKGLSAFRPDSMICVIGQVFRRFRSPETRKRVMGRTSGCRGDSGGPLIADTPAGPRQIGTVSFGPLYCGFRAKPSVYGRVSSALGFINAS